MSFESQYHAAALRALRESNLDDREFIDGMTRELSLTLSSIFLPSCEFVANGIILAGHRLRNDKPWDGSKLRVGYACTSSPQRGELRTLGFDLLGSAVTVVEHAPLLPPAPAAIDLRFDPISREALATKLGAGVPARTIAKEVRHVAENAWQAFLRPTWSRLGNRLCSMGYNFQQVHLLDESLDMRDLELRVHIGWTGIITAVIEDWEESDHK
ncbi:MAG: hypothetical protein KC431_09815 [Myxococcales bacterium]|nr:hypothetical protein [Myxococcales bacterium]